jgi:hypothetical protein
MGTLEHFDGYRGIGFKVIPLHPFSKTPVFRYWNRGYDHDRCRDFIEKHHCNLGLLLGDLLDVETDAPEAGEWLDRVLGDYPHPRYVSSRSVHHLFLNPEPRLTVAKADGIEFRANRHQSVLPPSVHEDGTKYQWLKPFVWPVPKLPEALVELLRAAIKAQPQKRKRRLRVVKKGHCRPWCRCCEAKVFMNRQRYNLEVEAFGEVGYPWMCRTCREVDVRQRCRDLRRRLNEVGHGVSPV